MKEVSYSKALSCFGKPSRVVLAVCYDRENKRSNPIALGWKMQTSIQPPMVAISVGKTRYSHKLLMETGEFVLAVPGGDNAKEVLFCGTNSGRNIDKLRETNLTPLKAKFIKPDLIKECVVNLECKVSGYFDTGDHTIFAGEVLTSWISEEEKKVLISVGSEEGYQLLLEEKGYRLGVIRG